MPGPRYHIPTEGLLKKHLNALIISLIVSIAVSGLFLAGVFESFELITLDLRLRTMKADRPAPVAFVSIDRNSLKALGEWPLPRGLYTQVIGKVLEDGAKAVLVDIDFSSHGPDPEQDQELIDFVSRAGDVVLAIQVEEKITSEGAVIRNLSLPLPELASAALALGSITFEIDPGGVIRRMPRSVDYIDITYRPLGVIGADLAGIRGVPPIPSDALITFSQENLAAYPNKTFDHVLKGRFDKGTFTDRVVLLGATAPDLHDFWPTPIGVIPGMYIQASVMETGLNRSWSTRQSSWAVVATLILLSVFLYLLLDRTRWKKGSLVLAGYTILVVMSAILFSRYRLMLQVVPLIVLGLTQYTIRIVMDLRKTEETLELQKRKTDTVLKFSELEDAEEAGKDTYLVPLVLLRQLLGLERIYLYLEDGDSRTGWRVENVIGEGPEREADEGDIVNEVVLKRQIVSKRSTIPDTVSVYVPMATSRKVAGVLCVIGPGELARDEENLRLLLSYATQTSYYIETSDLDRQIKLLYSSTIRAISKSLDKKDYYTGAHAELSLEYVQKFGQACGLSRFEVEALHIGTLLHDIGKIGVPDRILSKKGKLTVEEFESMKAHPSMGYEIIQDLPFPDEVKMIVKHHHEHYDGNGYPDGLVGDQIPKLVRIFSVLDTYEALVGERPYKVSYNHESAKQLLRDEAGKQFDPDIVEIFVNNF